MIFKIKKYALNSSYMSKDITFGRWGVLWIHQTKGRYALKSIWDSHRLNHVNFFHLEMETIGITSTP
jgi:hypothetical protein